MKIGYARVSTQDQKLELQISELEKYGCEKIFKEIYLLPLRRKPEGRAQKICQHFFNHADLRDLAWGKLDVCDLGMRSWVLHSGQSYLAAYPKRSRDELFVRNNDISRDDIHRRYRRQADFRGFGRKSF